MKYGIFDYQNDGLGEGMGVSVCILFKLYNIWVAILIILLKDGV